MLTKIKGPLSIKLLADIMNKGAGIILIPVLINSLGVEKYGAYSQVNVLIGFMSLVIVSGMDHSIINFISGLNDSKKTSAILYSLLSYVSLLSIPVICLIVFFRDRISKLFINDISGETLLLIGSVMIIISALNILTDSFLKSIQKIQAAVTFDFIQALANVIIIVVFVNIGKKSVELYYLMLVATNILMVSAKLLIIVGKYEFQHPSIATLKSLLKFGFPLLLSTLGIMLVNFGDRLILGMFVTSKEIGIYAASYSIGTIIFFIPQFIFYNLRPKMSYLKNTNQKSALKEIVTNYSNAYFLITLPAVVGLISILPELLKVLGPEISNSAILTTILILIGSYIYQTSKFYEYILIVFGDNKRLSSIYVFSAIINVALNIIMVPHMGINGAAVSTLITYVLIAVVLKMISVRNMRSPFDIKNILTTTTKTLGMALFIFPLSYLDMSYYFVMILKILLGIFIYIILSYNIIRRSLGLPPVLG